MVQSKKQGAIHIAARGKKAGLPAPCNAKIGCTLKTDAPHFDNVEEAKEWIQDTAAKNNSQFDVVKKVIKQQKDKTPVEGNKTQTNNLNSVIKELREKQLQAKNEDEAAAYNAISNMVQNTSKMGFEPDDAKYMMLNSLQQNVKAVEAAGHSWKDSYKEAVRIASKIDFSLKEEQSEKQKFEDELDFRESQSQDKGIKSDSGMKSNNTRAKYADKASMHCSDNPQEYSNAVVDALNEKETGNYRYKIANGSKYIKIARVQLDNKSGEEIDNSLTVHMFIDSKTGGFLKAAGWKSPAKGERYSPANIGEAIDIIDEHADSYTSWLYK